MVLSADDIAIMDARKAALEHREPQVPATDSVIQLDTIGPNHLMSVDKAICWGIVNARVERQFTKRTNDPIAIAFKKTFMDIIRLATDSVDFEKKITHNCTLQISIFRMIESAQADFYLETLLSSLTDSTMIMDSIFDIL